LTHPGSGVTGSRWAHLGSLALKSSAVVVKEGKRPSAGGLEETGTGFATYRMWSRAAKTRQETPMLDAYVIEEIKRRERDSSRDERPSIDLPLPVGPAQAPDRRPEDDEDDDRGVVIIDYS
jgi:hypothetical protein